MIDDVPTDPYIHEKRDEKDLLRLDPKLSLRLFENREVGDITHRYVAGELARAWRASVGLRPVVTQT
jgi:hypothetical protein